MRETIIVKNKKELQELIEKTILEEGPHCDLNHIDVSKIRSMSSLFMLSHFEGDISQWNTSNVTDMTWMFTGSMFNGDISGWNVSKVKKMGLMFAESPFNQDISNWNVKNVSYLRGIFNNCNQTNVPYWAKIEKHEERQLALIAYQEKIKLDTTLIEKKQMKSAVKI